MRKASATRERSGEAGTRPGESDRPREESAGVRILFVCLGNICRSPTAEAVMRGLVRKASLEQVIEVQSAGTGSWHVGEPPDERAVQAARRRGITVDGAARQVREQDFYEFDLIVAMDRSNMHALHALAPRPARAELRLLREFERAARADRRAGATGNGSELDVPDPYHGGPAGFERVLDLVEQCCAGLLDAICRDRLSRDGAAEVPSATRA
jgi:protein-tyrosine phosphatase